MLGGAPRGFDVGQRYGMTQSVGLSGLRLHDLRHTGNLLAAETGASTKQLMARMGQSSSRAALLYQHAAKDRDATIVLPVSGSPRSLGHRRCSPRWLKTALGGPSVEHGMGQ